MTNCLETVINPNPRAIDMTNLVVAGGAVFHALLLGNPVGDNAAARTVRHEAADGKSDIDIFIVADAALPPPTLRGEVGTRVCAEEPSVHGTLDWAGRRCVSDA